jgi:DnaJ-class molecular chaperone
MTPLDEAAALQTSAWETCFACKGSGMGPRMNGDPDGSCWECNGEGVLRARDKKGRFLPNPKETPQ